MPERTAIRAEAAHPMSEVFATVHEHCPCLRRRTKSELTFTMYRKLLILLVERKGIEPSTFALRTRRSPN